MPHGNILATRRIGVSLYRGAIIGAEVGGPRYRHKKAKPAWASWHDGGIVYLKPIYLCISSGEDKTFPWARARYFQQSGFCVWIRVA